MPEENTIKHLEAIREDIRDEIKRRIEQRDKYSIQLTIVLGAIVVLAFSKDGYRQVLVAAPLVSIYFTVLILYSYRIHRILTHYLRERVELKLAQLCGIAPELEWETYYIDHAVPGIRSGFFLVALWFICIASFACLWITESKDAEFKNALIVIFLLYFTAVIMITHKFSERWVKLKQKIKQKSRGFRSNIKLIRE